MKGIITAVLLLLSTITYSQCVDEYENKLATYLYLAIDHDGRMDCIDTNRKAFCIEYTEVSEGYVGIDCSEFTIDQFLKETITDDLLYRMYDKIYETYERKFIRRGKVLNRTSYEMKIDLDLHHDSEDPELIFGKTYVTFKIYFQ
jgi:hypothetical protein